MPTAGRRHRPKRTDHSTGVQQKVASIELEAGAYYGMAAWDDMVELFLIEHADQDDPPEWRYTIGTATGNVGERQAVDDYFFPTWCDDAAVYAMTYANNYRITRMDPATGEMQKIYSYPAIGDEYYYGGQRDGVLYFHHSKLAHENDEASRYLDDMSKLENGEMVNVITLEKEYGSLQTVEDEQGELQWVIHSDGSSMEIHDLNDGQTYYPAFKTENKDSAATGFPVQWMPDGRVLVIYGSAADSSLQDNQTYALIDRAAYLAGSTDYIPVEMYKGD